MHILDYMPKTAGTLKSLKIKKGDNQKTLIEEGQTSQQRKQNDKETNNKLQNTTLKTKDQTIRTLRKPGVNPGTTEE